MSNKMRNFMYLFINIVVRAVLVVYKRFFSTQKVKAESRRRGVIVVKDMSKELSGSSQIIGATSPNQLSSLVSKALLLVCKVQTAKEKSVKAQTSHDGGSFSGVTKWVNLPASTRGATGTKSVVQPSEAPCKLINSGLESKIPIKCFIFNIINIMLSKNM
jgi:hypothetical protein